MRADASPLTILRILCISEQLVLEQAAVVCCLALVTCECHWLSKLYNTFVGTGRDGSLQQLSSLPLLLRSQCLLTSDSSRGVLHLMLV
ncbi:hypothetical protein EMCRGX_G005727 [Ephydatia muelleri]